MTKELAKTLTTALVQFIDNERPEGSMCCSNVACIALEKALIDNDFEIVEDFIQYRLSELTKFESSLRQVLVEALSGEMPTGSSGSMSWAVTISDDDIKKLAPKILALVEKEIAKKHEHDVYIPENAYYKQLKKQWEEGYDDGKAEVLENLPRWRKWENGACGNSDGNPIAIVKRGTDYEFVSTLGIQGEQYIMLSDLEKLPGFNED